MNWDVAETVSTSRDVYDLPHVQYDKQAQATLPQYESTMARRRASVAVTLPPSGPTSCGETTPTIGVTKNELVIMGCNTHGMYRPAATSSRSCRSYSACSSSTVCESRQNSLPSGSASTTQLTSVS